MKKIHFVAAARDGNLIAEGYYSEEGVFLKYDAENPEKTEERKLKSLYEILQRKDIFIIHILDVSDASAEQQLYLPPRPEWITTIGWNDLTRTEAIIWTCLMISYRILKFGHFGTFRLRCPQAMLSLCENRCVFSVSLFFQSKSQKIPLCRAASGDKLHATLV